MAVIGEMFFNILYLISISVMVLIMIKRKPSVTRQDAGPALWVLLAFGFLALGDMGHVGFRVVAYAMGGLSTTVNIFGSPWNLSGLGSLATAWTFTLFYICMVFMWKTRFGKKLDMIAWLVLGLAVLRSVIMLLPGNAWDQIDPPRSIAVLRNLPLLAMQLGVVYLILRDAGPVGDRFFQWIAALILISFSFYAPVIFLYHSFPTIGMLMIPKTLAYLVIAYISLKNLFPAAIAAREPVPA